MDETFFLSVSKTYRCTRWALGTLETNRSLLTENKELAKKWRHLRAGLKSLKCSNYYKYCNGDGVLIRI